MALQIKQVCNKSLQCRGMTFILRTKESWYREGVQCWGYADGYRDDYKGNTYIGICIDTTHKMKYAQEWDSWQEAENARLEDPYSDQWEVIELKQ